MKKSKFCLVGCTLFMMVIGLNLQYALNDYGMLSLRFNPEILATGTGGSGTGEPDYVYDQLLVTNACVLGQIELKAGTYFNGVLLTVDQWHTLVGIERDCTFMQFSRCDRNMETGCVLIE